MQLVWPANISGLPSNHNAYVGAVLGWKQTLPLAFHFQNVQLLLQPSIITSPTASSILCLPVSRYDAAWGFSPACNASELSSIQPTSHSHILPLRHSTAIGLPLFRCVRVTLICDREPPLTGIASPVLAYGVVFSALPLFGSWVLG